MSDDEIVRLIKAMEMFDPSDDYHRDHVGRDGPGYYSAIDRCIALVKGEITDWMSPHSLAATDCLSEAS